MLLFLSNKRLASHNAPLPPRDNSPGERQAWLTFRILSQQDAGPSGSARDRSPQRLRSFYLNPLIELLPFWLGLAKIVSLVGETEELSVRHIITAEGD
ncbi:hypothetical protein NDU88_010429 [Pleurodeles waltl]|uniref:Uncharacterized protein n=1 Tax=Pleurodeles waltl TaxID=8319 RepID=A0AAV7QXD9_PLEWA|nr:hypothetical protein NDU88_010429 [Pleurodeles waltl]